MTPDGPARLDAAAVLAQFDGDTDLARELAEIFLADAPSQLAALRDAIDAGDADRLRRAAHTLKGSVGVFGAVALQTLAEQMEQAGRAGDLPAAGALAGDLDREAGALTALLETLA